MPKSHLRGQRDVYAAHHGHPRQTGARILELIDQVRVRPGQPESSPEEAEQMIDVELKTGRRTRRG